MADVLRQITRTVASVNGSQANSSPVRISGNRWGVRVSAPASLALVQTSSDKFNWSTANAERSDPASLTALSSLATGFYPGRERTMWVRGAVASDTSAVRTFEFIFDVFKEE